MVENFKKLDREGAWPLAPLRSATEVTAAALADPGFGRGRRDTRSVSAGQGQSSYSVDVKLLKLTNNKKSFQLRANRPLPAGLDDSVNLRGTSQT